MRKRVKVHLVMSIIHMLDLIRSGLVEDSQSLYYLLFEDGAVSMVNDSYYSRPERSTFRINCSVTGQGITRWFDSKGNRINNNPSDRLHVKTLGGALLLEISKLNKSDVGRYECRGDQTRLRAMLYVECKYHDTINFKAIRTNSLPIGARDSRPILFYFQRSVSTTNHQLELCMIISNST